MSEVDDAVEVIEAAVLDQRTRVTYVGNPGPYLEAVAWNAARMAVKTLGERGLLSGPADIADMPDQRVPAEQVEKMAAALHDRLEHDVDDQFADRSPAVRGRWIAACTRELRAAGIYVQDGEQQP